MVALLDALDGAPLQHVTLLQGTKAYGVHTGRAMRVPAREHDALLPPDLHRALPPAQAPPLEGGRRYTQ